ncbi:MAG: hypothetical protein K2Q01_01385, partial [Rickettsiales bacterium]|nr:hypothetical protein [Rickettsiales bacterium]
ASRDEVSLALPDQLDHFPEAALNRDLYFWLAAFFAQLEPAGVDGDDPLHADLAFLARARRAALAVFREFPGMVLCYRAHWLKMNAPSDPVPYMRIRRSEVFCAPAPCAAWLPTGVSGVLYPPGSLHAEVFREDLFLRLFPSADDIWFKVMALKQGVSAVRIGSVNYHPCMVPHWPRPTLKHINIHQGMNDVYLRALCAHYPDIARKLADAPSPDVRP